MLALLALIGFIVLLGLSGVGVRAMIETTRYMSPLGKLLSSMFIGCMLFFLIKAAIWGISSGE